jgi:hypothetical protein
MKPNSRLLLIALLTILSSCGEKVEEDEAFGIGLIPCQQQPKFLGSTGLDPRRSAFSTSERKIKGLVLVQVPANPNDTAGRKTWQHPSWGQFGWMGSITTDDNGNAYTAPVPVINILDNPPAKQNTIYKTDGQTGEMKALAELPFYDKNETENVFGILGLYFDCHARMLYASSVAASTRDAEKGVIYAVEPEGGKIKDKLSGRDAIGLCVCGITGEKRLYFGSSRNSTVYSVGLTKSGNFTGSVKEEFSLDMMGPRGDDKARRIRVDKTGDMIIFGVEFNYNLTAPTEKQETVYRFRYSAEDKKWLPVAP